MKIFQLFKGKFTNLIGELLSHFLKNMNINMNLISIERRILVEYKTINRL